jgi:hypothetical protein
MNRRTVHYVYVPGNHIRQPFSITNEVAARLREHYEVVIYDLHIRRPGSGWVRRAAVWACDSWRKPI